MNIVCISGRLVRNAVVFGREKQVLKFTIACNSGFSAQTQKPHTDYVPCAVFGATDKLRDLLVQGGKGKPVEIQGRITTSNFEQNGSQQFVTEVIADARDMHLARTGAALEIERFQDPMPISTQV